MSMTKGLAFSVGFMLRHLMVEEGRKETNGPFYNGTKLTGEVRSRGGHLFQNEDTT